MKKILFILVIISLLLLPTLVTGSDVTKENIDSIKANVSKRIQIISEDVHITSLEFVFSKDIGDTQFTISKLNNRPSRSPLLNYSIYEFFEIRTATISDNSYLTSANITFYVPKSWLNSLSIDKSAVSLLRFEDKEWEVLETNLIEETTSTYTFKAMSPGFDFFAITGIRDTEGMEEDISTEYVEEDIVIEEEDIVEAEDEESQIDPLILTLGGVIAILIIIVLCLVFRMRNIRKHRR